MNDETSKVRTGRSKGGTRGSRQPLALEVIVDAAAELADRNGLASVRMSQVAAELGRSHTSLYNRVESMEALHREIALRTTEGLADALTAAAVAKSGHDGLVAVARAYRSYVRAHRGRFEAAYTVRFSHDPELVAVFQRASNVIEAMLRSFGLTQDAAWRAHLAISSAIRGFVIGEAQIAETGSDPDDAFDDLIELFVLGLTSGQWPTAAVAPD